MNIFRKRKCLRLADKGFECLKSREYAQALEIARRLEEFRYTAAYDIAAQAHAGQGDIEQAVVVLKRGVEKAPDCWVNWELLGNYLSDLKRYVEAEDVYQRALQCPDVRESWIRLNQAALAHRQGKYEETLLLIDAIQDDDPRLRLRMQELRIDVLQNLGRVDEAIALANHTLAEPWEEDDGPTIARIAAILGRVRLERGEPKPELRKWVFDSLGFDRNNSDLLALIRDIDGEYSPSARYWRILVHCGLPEGHPWRANAKGFCRSCDVVADDPEDALTTIRSFEPDCVREYLCVQEAEPLEDRPDSPKGLYRQSGRCFYGSDDDESPTLGPPG